MKNWAQGSRLVLLTGHLTEYTILPGRRRDDFVDTVVNEYLRTYHWALPFDAEPDADDYYSNPKDPETPLPKDEDLDEAQRILKGVVIAKLKKVL